MPTSPHKPWKGCMLCKPYKHKANGQAVRQPWAVLRQAGKSRRVKRKEVPRDDV